MKREGSSTVERAVVARDARVRLPACTPVCAKYHRVGYVLVETDSGLEWRCDYHVTENYPAHMRNRLTRRLPWHSQLMKM